MKVYYAKSVTNRSFFKMSDGYPVTVNLFDKAEKIEFNCGLYAFNPDDELYCPCTKKEFETAFNLVKTKIDNFKI